MIKLIWISDTNNKGIAYRLFRKISNIKDFNNVNGEKAEDIIKSESSDFLYLDIKRPANTDVMNRLCLRNITRLRVSVFKLKPIRSRILKFFFPSDLIKTIARNILNESNSFPEKNYKDSYSH